MDNDILKNIVLEFLEKIGFVAQIKSVEEQDSFILVKIEAEDPKMLIGKNGKTLSAIEHILKLILRKKFSENLDLSVDVNDYKERKNEYLRDLAKSLADEVVFTKKEKELWPMPARERKIIHLELSKREDIVSESQGEGLSRKIVIKPIG